MSEGLKTVLSIVGGVYAVLVASGLLFWIVKKAWSKL